VLTDKAANRFWQDIKNGGFARSDVEITRIYIAKQGGKVFLQLIDTFHQRFCKVIQGLAFWG